MSLIGRVFFGEREIIEAHYESRLVYRKGPEGLRGTAQKTATSSYLYLEIDSSDRERWKKVKSISLPGYGKLNVTYYSSYGSTVVFNLAERISYTQGDPIEGFLQEVGSNEPAEPAEPAYPVTGTVVDTVGYTLHVNVASGDLEKWKKVKKITQSGIEATASFHRIDEPYSGERRTVVFTLNINAYFNFNKNSRVYGYLKP